MNINLHIERLVMDGLDIEKDQGNVLAKTLEAELTRLFSDGGLAPDLQSGEARLNILAGTIELSGNENPLWLGKEIARSIYSRIGECK